MYTQNGNPVAGLGSVPLPSGPVAGGRFDGESLGQAKEESAEQEQYVRVTEEPAEIVPVASAAEAQQLIAMLQTRLQQRNFDPGTIDGLWGPKTAGALDAGRVARSIPKGTNRVAVIQQVIGVDRSTATRINDAINYQLTARAEKTPAAPAAEQPMTVMPDGTMVPAATALSQPIYKKWWFWGLILAGVATAGVVTYVVIKKRGEEDEFYPEGDVDESFIEAEDEDF